jgi:anti-sigma factor RsiW
VLHAYLDGELDAPGAAEFERHLEGCAACVRALEVQESLRSSIQHAQLNERMPATLHRKIRKLIREASVPSTMRRIFNMRLLAAAFVALLVTGISWKLLPRIPADSSFASSALAAEIVDAHIRSLQPGHLTDVTSTDQHTVKPWFDGQLAFAPPVSDLTEQGFPLVGGRLDVLEGQTVAALVYGRRKHYINVFVWPAGDSGDEQYTGAKNGYRWISWVQGGMRFCAVSDVNGDDLASFKELLSR